MQVVTRGLVIALAAVFVAAAAATAATPRAGATYKGKLGDNSLPTVLKLKVSATKKSLNATIDCGAGRLLMKNVRIDDQGRFQKTGTFGTAPGAIKGRFVTRRKAKGTVSTNACFINSGAEFTVTR